MVHITQVITCSTGYLWRSLLVVTVTAHVNYGCSYPHNLTLSSFENPGLIPPPLPCWCLDEWSTLFTPYPYGPIPKGDRAPGDQRGDKTLALLGYGRVWSCCGIQGLSNSSILPIMLPALQSSLRSPPGERTSQIRNVLNWILFWCIIFKTVISIWELFVLILSVSWTHFFSL